MTAIAAEPEPRRGAQFLILWLIPVLVAAVVSFAPVVLSDGDTFWHLATGGWILDHGQIPRTDPFSYTFAGRPWVTHEWLSEVVMAGAFRLAGWSGVMLVTGLSMGATAAVMARWLFRWLAPLSTVAALTLGVDCLASSVLARPHIVALPVLALWTLALLTPQPARFNKRFILPWTDLPVSKLLHVAMYAVLTWLAGLLPMVHRRWLFLLGLSLHAMLTELGQSYVPERYGSWTDVGLDHCGIAIGLALRWSNWFPARRKD